jgi:hypothetical protein
VHLVHLPQEARNEDVCFKWTQSAQLLSVNGRLLSDAPNMSNNTDLGGRNSSEVIDVDKQNGENRTSSKETIAPIYRIDDIIHVVTHPPIKTFPPYQSPVRGDKPSRTYKSCWAMDNILIVNVHNLPARLYEDFDPVDPSNWLFFPGANIRVSFELNPFFQPYYAFVVSLL